MRRRCRECSNSPNRRQRWRPGGTPSTGAEESQSREEMRGQSHAGLHGACSGNACPKSQGTGKQAIRAGASMRRTCIGTLLLKKSEV